MKEQNADICYCEAPQARTKTIRVGFDYKEAGMEVFDTWLGVVIWMLWKENYITNQCFDDEVRNITDAILKIEAREEMRLSESEFFDAFNSMQMSHGVEHASIRTRLSTGYGSKDSIRNEEIKFDKFLSDVFYYWRNPDNLKLDIV